MNNKVEVSVIIPVFNVKSYLKRCVESVLNQSYRNIEIILVDDGSTDESGKMCDDFLVVDNRIKVFHKSNGGLGSARNYGIEHSSGNHILFLDSDDYIDTNTVEKLMEYSNYDIVCCGFDRVDEETKKVYSTEMIGMSFDELEINDKTINETAFLSPSGWGKLFKRELIGTTRFSSNKKSIEDTLFYLEIIPKTKKIKYIKEILWHYMVRKNSLIMALTEEKADLFENELLDIKQRYIELNYSKERFDFLTVETFIHNCISIPSRLYNNKDVKIRYRLKHIKRYMNENFEDWKKVKFNIKGQLIKKVALHIVRFMYKINIFILFLRLYNFAINKLKIDIKW